MNRVIKTVKTYDYGNGVRVEKVNREIERYWINDGSGRIAFNVHNGEIETDSDGDPSGILTTKHNDPDPMGRYCYFIDPINLNTIVLWKTKTQLLKGIPKIVKNNGGSFSQLMAIREDRTDSNKPLEEIQKEMDETDKELQNRQAKITEDEELRFKKIRDKFFSGMNRTPESFIHIPENTLSKILEHQGDTITYKRLLEMLDIETLSYFNKNFKKYKTDGVEINVREMNDYIAPYHMPNNKNIEDEARERDRLLFEFMEKQLKNAHEQKQEMDPGKIVELKLLNMQLLSKTTEQQQTDKYTLGELYDKVNKEINEENDRLRLLEITTAAQDKYGTLFNCLRIFGAHDDEEILARHVDYLELHEPITNGYDVAIAIRQTRDCAREELNAVKNLLTHDEVLHLIGVLENVI